MDHFNHQDERTWEQQYYFNATNWSRNGPIFFELGGESSVWSSWQRGRSLTKYAEAYNALHVVLEHRYYGLSWPTNNTETPNLQWLSTEQALADAAYFIQWFKHNISSDDSPVITFGGSYSGNLAAWLRMKYPHVTIAAVASSAPVLAVVDFYDYVRVVDRSLTFFSGPLCESVIRNATMQIEKLLETSDGQASLAKMFKWCSPIQDPRDKVVFLSVLMGTWQGVVQYNNEIPERSSVASMCPSLEQGAATPFETYVKFMVNFWDVSDCMNISYWRAVEQMRKTTNDLYSPYTGRHWFYQTCSEFGYYVRGTLLLS